MQAATSCFRPEGESDAAELVELSNYMQMHGFPAHEASYDDQLTGHLIGILLSHKLGGQTHHRQP